MASTESDSDSATSHNRLVDKIYVLDVAGTNGRVLLHGVTGHEDVDDLSELVDRSM
jgi:hypothetical protein